MTEALLALEMERRYSKNEILEMYLNYTFFGAGAYGIEAAAQTYFSVSACDLSVEQAATLAAILKSPTYYAPHKYPENSLARRNAILSLMAGNGLLDEEQAQKAAETDLSLNMQVNNNEGSWYLDAAIDEACELLDLTWQEVTEGGYRIYTGLDRELQEACDLAFSNEDLFPKNAKDGSQPQAALICTEPSTGRISAVVGGRAYSVRRGLNRAIRARRQPGSCIKPILVYAPALQNRVITPATIFVDEAKTFDSYAPANYNNKYYGTVTARTALIKSLNIPAVEILSRNGINSSVSFAKNLGIPFEESDIGLSLALGGFQSGVTPLELCGAYSALASMGVYINPHFITRIESADGKIIYQAKEKGYTAVEEGVAYLITDMLKEAVQSGTGKALYMSEIPLSGKTGTNGYGKTGNRDIWMAAYNKEIAAVCWMGFDQTDEQHFLLSSETGSGYPAKLLRSVFLKYYENKTAPSYETSAEVVHVNLDKSSLMNGVLVRANQYAQADTVVSELFLRDQVPSATVDELQCLAFGLTVDLTRYNVPELVFSASSSLAQYAIMRTSDGVTVELDRLPYQPILRYVDPSVEPNKAYTYYVQPILNNKPLGGACEKVYIVIPTQ